ncbi:hypothetical protein ACFCYI_12970 [Streptomyces sp. NPDC056257]|uniref:hypothetical protein n=1 Tax=Streptomyces sp. NPDC056257 TaxID=3345765 RepID=UPI0035D6FA6E
MRIDVGLRIAYDHPSAPAPEPSSLLARMAFHHAWLQIEAPKVAGPYAALVASARSEACVHMSEAWQQPPIDTGSGMNGPGVLAQTPAAK